MDLRQRRVPNYHFGFGDAVTPRRSSSLRYPPSEIFPHGEFTGRTEAKPIMRFFISSRSIFVLGSLLIFRPSVEGQEVSLIGLQGPANSPVTDAPEVLPTGSADSSDRSEDLSLVVPPVATSIQPSDVSAIKPQPRDIASGPSPLADHANELPRSTKTEPLQSVGNSVNSAIESQLVRDRDSQGRVVIERWVTESSTGDFVNHGEYLAYDSNGKVAMNGRYEMGIKVGQWTQAISQQQLSPLLIGPVAGFQAPFQSQASFTNGQLDGDWIVSDAQGKRLVQWGFSGGLRNGDSLWFNPKGELLQSVRYVDNVPHGPAQIANLPNERDVSFEQGRLLRKIESWYDGNRKSQKKSVEWVLAPSGLTIDSQNWDTTSVQYLAIAQADVVRHGELQNWYANGQMSHQGQYENGTQVGDFYWWYPSGQLQSQGGYVSGLQDGPWTWWHENGMKRVQGEFAQGERIGIWSQWKASGSLVARTDAVEFAELAPASLAPAPVESATKAPVTTQPTKSAHVRKHRNSRM